MEDMEGYFVEFDTSDNNFKIVSSKEFYRETGKGIQPIKELEDGPKW